MNISKEILISNLTNLTDYNFWSQSNLTNIQTQCS